MTDKLAVTSDTSIEQWSPIEGSSAALMRKTIFNGMGQAECDLAIAISNHLRLNPILKQIYFIMRRSKVDGQWVEKMTTQIGIDGMRLIAQRTVAYMGQTEPQWCGPDGKWLNIWLGDKPPSAARCGVYRRGWANPLYAVAVYAGYSSDNSMWRSKGDVMIHKCAESLALRKAFPAELSGIYTNEEMEQADVDDGVPDAVIWKSFNDRLAQCVDRDDMEAIKAMGANLPDRLRDGGAAEWRKRLAELKPSWGELEMGSSSWGKPGQMGDPEHLEESPGGPPRPEEPTVEHPEPEQDGLPI